MLPLTIHDRQVHTVFDLLGHHENDMTYSLGWALSKVPRFLELLIQKLEGENGSFSQNTSLRLQEHRSELGFTDLEIYDPGRLHIIIEAKRGFTVPTLEQLSKYAKRLIEEKDEQAKPLLVVLSESDRQDLWLQEQVPQEVYGVSTKTISWRQFINLAIQAKADCNRAEKQLLHEFISYLGKVTTMQNKISNLVYVVSLGRSCFDGGVTTFIDVVEQYGKYFHPVGGGTGGWPVEPPNYIAFRYGGALRSIHHIESYEVVDDFAPYFKGQPSVKREPHFLYTLGPAIKPPRHTPTGTNWRANRVWCFIDLLLTCDSIVEARQKTRDRLSVDGQEALVLSTNEDSNEEMAE